MIKRIFARHLQRLLEVFPVVAVVGCRQVGKSTLVQMPEIRQGRRYITLDDLSARKLAQTDPRALLEDGDGAIVDEVQLAPDLLREVKRVVDADRRPGRFILTGSAELNRGADLAAVLAGRVGVLQLPPITLFEEWEEAEKPLWTRMWMPAADAPPSPRARPFEWRRLVTGGFPLSLTAPDDETRRLWMESFRTTYLERDLRRISDIGHLSDFSRLMELAAARTGQILNRAALARDAGLSSATAGRYFSILEASFLIRRLAPHHQNIGKRLVKSPKLFWRDTGLAVHLLGVRDVADPDFDRLRGALFETAVMMEIEALLPLFAPEARLSWMRSHDGLEVDGLIRMGRRRIPFEIKAARSVTPDDARPLRRWMEASGDAEGPAFILHAGDEVYPVARNVMAIPFRGWEGHG